MSVNRTCEQQAAEWISVDIVRARAADWDLPIHALESVLAATRDHAVTTQFPCDFDGTVDIETRDRGREFWVCPKCGTEHLEDVPDDDGVDW